MSHSWTRAGSVVVLLITALPGCTSSPPAPPAAQQEPALPTIELTETPAFPLKAHLESADIVAGKHDFEQLFEAGRGLFHTAYNGLDGVGVAVRADGTRISRFAPLGPRGPFAQSCVECHALPYPAGAGLAHGSVIDEPDKDNAPPFNVRSVISMFGNGILQLLAQEMTEELQAIRDDAVAEAKAAAPKPARRELRSKGTSYGWVVASVRGDQVVVDFSEVAGIDPDLVVRPFGWKGDTAILRNFSAAVSSGAMGLQPEELVWKNPATENDPDPDGDGVVRELSVGDITAMTVYSAAQETPVELSRLVALGYVQAPSTNDVARIEAGRTMFGSLGCASCHTPEMHLRNTVYEEPTARGNGYFYDHALAKRDPTYDPKRPFSFDILAKAQPPRPEAHAEGGAIIRLYGDLKRHAMGRHLADPAGPSQPVTSDLDPVKHQDKPVMIPADQFLTAELWGVANTGPWLHDNRAGTLREAILLHGEDQPPAPGRPGRSEAQEARDAFAALSAADQASVIAFLRSLQTFSPE